MTFQKRNNASKRYSSDGKVISGWGLSFELCIIGANEVAVVVAFTLAELLSAPMAVETTCSSLADSPGIWTSAWNIEPPLGLTNSVKRTRTLTASGNITRCVRVLGSLLLLPTCMIFAPEACKPLSNETKFGVFSSITTANGFLIPA